MSQQVSIALARKGLQLAIYCEFGLQLVDRVLCALGEIKDQHDTEKIQYAEDALFVYNQHASECAICCNHVPVRLGEIDDGSGPERRLFPIRM